MRLIPTVLATTLMLAPLPARSLEINGQTSFVAVPTKARLVNYRWYAFEGRAVYYVVLDFPEGADAALGGISLEQIRGVQPAFLYGAVPVKAFIGTPRRESRAIPTVAEFSNQSRTVNVQFKEPVAPGNTVTVAFKAGTNPPADLYTFTLAAIPFGPSPIPQVVGVVQMDILNVN
ncbi:secreted protein of unknown function DUF2808 [Synechococcus sp. MEDNS5]|uniref:DUF2808 domain-containing protein n=1 Tax=Synechococcus sp. MEDNS5 TaxID=1442554 RepID=UPI001644ACD1|nr:DUF2808 domain-containing protein [Synechococcus sp. MEDNS5]QNJ05486.1 secreted protein of unknown function DUF2808 [Synechococcus sp. MEDNS5]